MTARFDPRALTIAGAGGKSRDTPSEAPNDLKSNQVARVVDLLSEGPIRGVVGNMQGVLLDGTQVMSDSGTLNYEKVDMQFVLGYPDQPIMRGFEAQEAEQSVSTQLRYNLPVTRSILSADCDRCRITVSVPTLQSADDDGDINGTSVQFRIDCQSDAGGFQQMGSVFTISGKTNSRYQQAVIFTLPRQGPWDIKVTRLTADSTTAKLQNDLYWDSYTEITDDRVNYSHSACVGITIDARQFQSIPKRTYLTDGLLMQIPSNYNPFAATYSGTWDGTFNFEWCNNPAWVFYDLVVNNRYGIGDFIPPSMVDKWSLYKIAVWCDQLISDGKGGMARRYTCNMQIMEQSDAFDLLGQICSIFRGFTYWTGGQLVAVADMPSDPVMQFTNANVINGQFSYAGADARARHTMASTSWRDPDFLGEVRFAVVENQAQISRLGIQRADLTAVGCTDEAQALRTGKWTIYSEQYESEIVQFSTGLESAWCRPGDIIQIMDATIAGTRRGGRVIAGTTTTHVMLDSAMTAPGTAVVYLSCVIGEGAVETRPVILVAGNRIDVSPAFSQAPAADTIFVLNAAGVIEPTQWRVIGSKQSQADAYEVSAKRHLPSKWDYIEKNLVLTIPKSSGIKLRPDAVTGLAVIEYLVQTSPLSVGVHATLSWISTAPQFNVTYRKGQNNWIVLRVNAQAVDLVVSEGIYEFQVTPLSAVGMKGPTSSLVRNIIGRFAPPGPPLSFRINVVNSVALFDWLPSTDLDVQIGGHYELRFSGRTEGADWYTSQVVVPSIPGTATSVEAGYLAGTWFLRTFDIVGTPSTTWAVILAELPDSTFVNFFRICEQPTWPGTHNNTTIKMPQEWLTIAPSGMVPGQISTGNYYFSQIIDAGGTFAIRLSSSILAFQYSIPDDFLDSRLTYCDTWSQWDSSVGSLTGEITLLISTTTDDPLVGSPNWSPWSRFIASEYYARAFRFQAVLTADEGQNIGVEELCVLADLRNKLDQGDDIGYPAVQTRVTFAIKFYLAPAIVVTVQNAIETDRVQIVAKTNKYFDIKITNAGGAQVTRTFDWHAQGY